MKCKTVIDPTVEEQILIYAHERTHLIAELERIAAGDESCLLGYGDGRIVRLDPALLDCFAVEGRCVYAIGEERLRVRERLYELEKAVGDQYVRINQSCIVNVSRILRFEPSFSGSLLVVMRGGYRDYVSRRQLRAVKERLGLRK